MIRAEEVVDEGKRSLFLPGKKLSVILANVRVTPLLIVLLITVCDEEMTEIVVGVV